MDEVKRIIDDWPAICKDAAEKTISIYGPPNEAAPSRLTWYNNGINSAETNLPPLTQV